MNKRIKQTLGEGEKILIPQKCIKAFFILLFVILKTHWKIQFVNLNSKRKKERLKV